MNHFAASVKKLDPYGVTRGDALHLQTLLVKYVEVDEILNNKLIFSNTEPKM